MKKFNILLGLNDKDTKTQIIDTDAALLMVYNTVLKYTDGATITTARGIYKHESGEVVIENSINIELLFTTLENVKKIAEVLRVQFNQESVIIQSQNIQSDLYFGEAAK